MDGLISKPVKAETLYAALTAVLESRSASEVAA